MSIIRVLTTSLGVVMKAAMAPAVAALAPAMAPVSRIRWCPGSRRGLVAHSRDRKCSKIGNCMAVKGRFRASSAV